MTIPAEGESVIDQSMESGYAWAQSAMYTTKRKLIRAKRKAQRDEARAASPHELRRPERRRRYNLERKYACAED